jgi:hypothetical protein
VKNNYFLILVIAGLLGLIGLQVTRGYDPDRKKFIAECTLHGLYVIEKACKEIGIEPAFKAKESGLREDYDQYCTCLAGVWKENDFKLRPGFFSELRKPEAQRSEETRRLITWVRLPATRSSYARCHNASNLNLNWIANEDMKKRATQSRPK